VLTPRGILFEEKVIQTALDLRFSNGLVRKRGVYENSSKPFLLEDRARIKLELIKILSKFAGFL
jgi:uncharacterized protein YaiI (UPF0178 family)